MEKINITPIGKIYTDMPQKFGIPRQSGIVKELTGTIIFDPPYNVKEAFEGIEEYSHLWILWQFSENADSGFSPTVRPPRLGGEVRKGVFATRSPFRPNSIGLSCVELLKVEYTKPRGVTLTVGGADMKSGTPVLDIKPYIAYADSVPNAKESFAGEKKGYSLSVSFPDGLLDKIPREKQTAIIKILGQDPRPAYQNDKTRIYGVLYAGFNIKFTVDGGALNVIGVEEYRENG